jgi:hypothetical protein
MKLNNLLCTGILTMTGLAQADVQTTVPPLPGPPYYSEMGINADGSLFYAHDSEWAAIWFLRDPSCIPAAFNLLETADFIPAFPGGPPRPFLCPMTVSGLAIWKNGPPPIDPVPVQENWHGLGAVPVWFVRVSEFEAAAAGGTLTITTMRAMPSLRKGLASVFEEVDHPGMFRPQGLGNGSLELSSKGTLDSGMSFQFDYNEMGKKNGDGVIFVRHVRIDFK